MDLKLIGKKLKEARESLKISIEETANQLNITSKDYDFIEKGWYDNLNGDMILILADYFKRDFRYFVTGDYDSVEKQTDAFFRNFNELETIDRKQILEFMRTAEKFNNLYFEILKNGRPLPYMYSRSDFTTDNHKWQGIQAAYKERGRLGLGINPVDNIFDLLFQQGIILFRKKLFNNKISGVYLKHPIAEDLVLINYAEDIYRQKFSAAHEYSHILFDKDIENSLSYYTTPKLNGENEDYTSREWRANGFAGNFLFPYEFLHKNGLTLNSENELIEYIKENALNYKVNSKVIFYNLCDHKAKIGNTIVNTKEHEHILNNKELKITCKIDPDLPEDLTDKIKEKYIFYLQSGLSKLLINSCVKAFEENKISLGAFAEIVNMNKSEFVDFSEVINISKLWS